MTTHDLAEQLRGLASGLRREGEYDPATDAIIYIPPSEHSQPRFAAPGQSQNIFHRVYAVIRDARQQGVFDSPGLVEFKRLTADRIESTGMLAVLNELDSRGFDPWNVKPDKGSIERLADMLERIGKPDKTKRRPRKRTIYEHGLTARQSEAVQLYAKHNGKITLVARAMKLKHPTVRQHLDAAWQKLPEDARPMKLMRPRIRNLPTDRRGQIMV